MNHSFRNRLQSGELLVGTMVTLASTELAELLTGVGFDWLFVDAEHSPMSADGVHRVIQGAGSAPCLVRLAASEAVDIKKALDVGAGGTLLGFAETLKEENPDLVVSGIVPTDDPRIEWVRSRAVHQFLQEYGLPKMRFLIEDLLDQNLMDNEITVKNEDAKNMAGRLCREEGFFCGMSSGANVWAAVELAKTMKKGSRIVTVLVDRRDRYFAEYPNEYYIV